MSDISITRKHDLSPEELRARVEKTLVGLKAKLGVKGSWSGDTCTVAGKGIKKCEIKLQPDTLTFDVKLGMAFKLMKGQIEKQITAEVDKIIAS
jgi:putative polyhydroxyalkanoate system protein